MTPNFIDTLAAGESFPAWFFPLLGGLIVAGMIAALVLGVWLARRDFRRDRGAVTATMSRAGLLTKKEPYYLIKLVLLEDVPEDEDAEPPA